MTIRAERCACGGLLRWTVDEHAWPRLMAAHVRTRSHELWRVRQGVARPGLYEETLPPVERVVRRVV